MSLHRTCTLVLPFLAMACSSEATPPVLAADSGTPTDGGVADTAAADGPVADPDAGLPPIGPLCDLTKPFTTFTTLSTLTPKVFNFGVTLSYDELEIYFGGWTPVPNKHDIYVATRPAKDKPFGAATLLWNVSSPVEEKDPSLSADGLTLYFAHDDKIFVSKRASRSASFGPAVEVPSIKSALLQSSPYLTIDGTELWYRSASDLYRAPVNGGVVGAPVRIDELDIAKAFDLYPALSADRLVVYFSSDRVNPGNAFKSVYVARRASASAPFDAPVSAAEFGTQDNEYPGYFSPDGCRLYFVSGNRGVGNMEIFVAERAP